MQTFCRMLTVYLLQLMQLIPQAQTNRRYQANIVAVATVRADKVLRFARVSGLCLRLKLKRFSAVVTGDHVPSLARSGRKNYAR